MCMNDWYIFVALLRKLRQSTANTQQEEVKELSKREKVNSFCLVASDRTVSDGKKANMHVYLHDFCSDGPVRLPSSETASEKEVGVNGSRSV